jgi:hypothetical protein
MPRTYASRGFWEQVCCSGECWEWTGTLFQNGYGRYGNQKAHRIAWVAANGPIPKGLLVCHKCDNRRCINPDHLFVGTQKDNIQDAWSKGRTNMQKNPGPYRRDIRGPKNPNGKLNDWQVVGVFARWLQRCLNQTDIAKEFGVHQTCVSRVVRLEFAN